MRVKKLDITATSPISPIVRKTGVEHLNDSIHEPKPTIPV